MRLPSQASFSNTTTSAEINNQYFLLPIACSCPQEFIRPSGCRASRLACHLQEASGERDLQLRASGRRAPATSKVMRARNRERLSICCSRGASRRDPATIIRGRELRRDDLKGSPKKWVNLERTSEQTSEQQQVAAAAHEHYHYDWPVWSKRADESEQLTSSLARLSPGTEVPQRRGLVPVLRRVGRLT